MKDSKTRTAGWIALLAATPALAAPVALQTEKSEKFPAPYITDAEGRALYMFEADRRGKGKEEAVSNCYDACAKAWPPLTVEQPPQVGPQLDKSLVGTIQRKNGKTQVTYNGWPLYYFVKDKGKGEATGQDVHGFGGEWYLLTAEGEKVGHARCRSHQAEAVVPVTATSTAPPVAPAGAAFTPRTRAASALA